MTPTTILLIIWLFAVVCSGCGMLCSILLRRQPWFAVTLDAVAVLVGVMGITGRTPFGRLPEIGWSWSNDSFLISMRLGSAFIVPLVLAMSGLAMLTIRAVALRQQARR